MGKIRSFNFKCVILGQSFAGKSSILVRYLKRTFSDKYIPTLGANFIQTDLKINEELDGSLNNIKTSIEFRRYNEIQDEISSKSKLLIYDLAGQVLFKNIRKYYMIDADMVVIIVDLNDLESNDFCTWLDSRKELCPRSDLIIVGNKSDLIENAEIIEKKFKDKIKKLEFEYNKEIPIVSAKNGNGIPDLFKTIKIRLVASI